MTASREALRFLPQRGHWDRDTAIDRHGSLVATFHLSGHPSELSSAQASVAHWLQDNRLAQGVSSPRVEWWDHFTRLPGQAMTHLPPSGNWQADRLDRAYREMPGNRALFRNDLFVTVLLHREDTLGAGLRSLLMPPDTADADDAMTREFADLMHLMEAGLSRYGLRRLGLRRLDGQPWHSDADGEPFSEIFEAWHVIANNRFRPIGLSANHMGQLIVPERPVFDLREWRMIGEAGPQCGAILTFLDYPTRTRPTMFDELRAAPYGITITNATRCEQRTKAIGRISSRIKQRQSGNDPARKQTAQMADEENDLADRTSVPVQHHFSVAVHAASLAQLDRNVAHASQRLADAGVTAIRETDAIKPAFYAQIPGNLHWAPGRAPTKSLNSVALAARNNVPRGNPRGRWGAPILMLRTTQDTEYAFHFHVQGSAQFSAEDMGNCLIVGPPGSGKTGLLATVATLALRVPGARCVFIDNQLGLSVAIKAADGSYLELRSGVGSRVAPLKGLDDTPEDRAHLDRWMRGLILSDGQGEMTSLEDERLTQGIARQMTMPQHLRSIEGVQVMLPQRAREGGRDSAAARLKRWCRGERLGWAFDGEHDELDMSRRLTGIDTTALLKDETVCSPMLAHLFYRARKLINGKPLVLGVDEAWQIDRVPAFAEQTADDLATIRKNEGVVVLATQNASTFVNSPIGFAYRQQVPTRIFFADSSADHDVLVGQLGLTEAEFEAVTQTLPNRRHTFLMQRPGGSVLCKFDLSGAREKIAVLSARRATYDLMQRLIAEHGDEPQAWVPHFERLAPHVVDNPTLDHGQPTADALRAAPARSEIAA